MILRARTGKAGECTNMIAPPAEAKSAKSEEMMQRRKDGSQ